MEMVPQSVELLTALVNIAGIFCCVYVAKTLDEDKSWLGRAQRLLFLLLAFAFAGNAFLEFQGGSHRPTGLLVALTASLIVIVMAVRAHRDITQNRGRRG